MMLEVRDLKVSYGHVAAVKGISIDVAEGSVVALVGANGAGKSSLLKGLAGLERFSGSARYRGEELSELSAPQRVARGLVLCPEGRHIFPACDVQENLRMGAYRRGDYRKNTEMVFDLFPILRERRGQMAGYLSGGEQQMLAIGRALMADPELLMLDEPSLGLAPRLVDQVFEVISSLSERGYSILLVEQNATRALAVAGQAYILETGRMVHSGPGPELLESDEIRRAYLGL